MMSFKTYPRIKLKINLFSIYIEQNMFGRAIKPFARAKT